MDSESMALGRESGLEVDSKTLSGLEEENNESVPITKEVDFFPGLFKFYSFVTFYAFLALISYLWTTGGFMAEQRLWAGIICFLGVAPFILFFWNGHPGRIPFFELLAFYHAIAFGLGGFWPGIGDVTPQVLLPALKGSALGLLALILGYYGAGSLLFHKVERFRLDFNPSMVALLPYAWVFVAVDQSLMLVNRPWPVISFLQQAVPIFGWLGTGIIWLNFLRNGKLMKRSNFIFIFVILPYEFLWRSTSGSYGQVMALVMMLGIVYVNYRKSIPFGLIFFSVFLAFLIQPIKGQYRDIAWSAAGDRMTLVEKAQLFWRIGTETYGYVNPIKSNGNPDALERLSQLGVLAQVINMSPALVPFQYGTTFLPLLTKWIPRLVWPGKPIDLLGNNFGHWYSFLSSDDFTTSVNVPWLVEFYVNLGWSGILLGMFFLGILMYYLSLKFCGEEQSLLEYSLAISVVFQLWWAESNFAMMWGGSIISIVTYGFFFWVLQKMNVELTAAD